LPVRDANGKKKRIFPYGVFSDQPAMRVKPGVKVSMNRNVLRSLGYPKHIQFWWADSEKTLLIGSAPSDVPSSLVISNYSYRVKGNINFRNALFLNSIAAVTKWQNGAAYSMLGEYVPELDMVAFRTESAVEMEVTANAQSAAG
jgi:hypothetical protein